MPPKKYVKKYRKKSYKKRQRPSASYIRKIARTSGETKISKFLWTPDGKTINTGVQTTAPVSPERAWKLHATSNLFIPFTQNPIDAGWNDFGGNVPNAPNSSLLNYSNFIPQGILRYQRVGAKCQLSSVRYKTELQITAVPPITDTPPQYPITAEFRLIIGWVKASGQVAYDRLAQLSQLYSEVPYALFKVSTDRIIKRRALYSGLNASTTGPTPITYQVPSYTDIPINYNMTRPMNINFRETDVGAGTSEISNWTPFIVLINPNSAIIKLTTKFNRHIIAFKDP